MSALDALPSPGSLVEPVPSVRVVLLIGVSIDGIVPDCDYRQ
jgi:hypothetical protein